MFWVSRASRPWGFIVGDPPLCASIARRPGESYERADAAPRRRAPGRTAHPLVTFVCGPILIHSPAHEWTWAVRFST